MTLLTLHLLSMLFSVGVIFVADKEALAWFSGKRATLSHARVRALHALMWAGLLSLIGSGFLMFLPMAPYLLSQPLFIIKMLFVAILVVNAVLIGHLMDTALTRPRREVSVPELLPLMTSGAVSLLSWAAAILIAFYLF
jgi:hypothetical protein